MAENREAACLAETLKWEGGYSNHPKDPGGPTMRGVIQTEYDKYRRQNGKPTQWVKLIEQDELLAIYKKNYWEQVRGDELPAGVDLVLFDYAVNSGHGRAIMSTQVVLGVGVDGVLGDATMNAIKAQDPVELCKRMMKERLRFLKSLRGLWPTFGEGWSNRCAGVEAAAIAAAGAVPKPAPVPLANEDKQSKTQGRAVGLFTIPAADGPEGYEYEGTKTPSEAHQEQKDLSWYYARANDLRTMLGLPTLAATVAFFKENGLIIMAAIVIAVIFVELSMKKARGV